MKKAIICFKKIAKFVIGVATFVGDQDCDCGWSYNNCGWCCDNCD